MASISVAALILITAAPVAFWLVGQWELRTDSDDVARVEELGNNPVPTRPPTEVVPARALTPQQIAKRVSPSVVLLAMEDATGRPLGMGSGFVVRDGVVATNMHVIEGATRGYVKRVDDESKADVGGILAQDAAHDLVLLSVDGLKADALGIGDSNAVAVGDVVYAVGNPRGLEGTFSAGIVSSVRKVGDDSLLQITAPISPGSSGGPVVNSRGEVIGIAVALLKDSQNLNFAVPSEYLKELLTKDLRLRPLEDSATRLAEVEPGRDSKPSGEQLERFWPAIVEALRKAAEGGDADAMHTLGAMYASGRGVVQDDREAVKWFRKAAEAGSAAGMASLGGMYTFGRGVAQDDREAVKWYRKAAEAGDAVGMCGLGVMYDAGRGVTKDNREAVKWYRKAAEAGAAAGMHGLGVMYREGRGVAQDDREAVKWFRKAAHAGMPHAMRFLGVMYYEGRGVTQDDAESYVWLSVASAVSIERVS